MTTIITDTTIATDETTAAAPTLDRTFVAIHHIGLTVTDAEASAAWYERVLGLERKFVEPHHGSTEGGYSIVLGTPDLSLAIGLDHHPGNPGDAFDPQRTGLDHLCLVVPSVDHLHGWAEHLKVEGVANSGVYAIPGMGISLVTFRDPDGIQLELFAFASH